MIMRDIKVSMHVASYHYLDYHGIDKICSEVLTL
jgi:hypothetical protein